MIPGQVSSQTILAKVNRDFNVPISEMGAFVIEWIGEAVESIGAYSTMQFRSTGDEGEKGALYVENHRVEVPCELESIIAIEYKGSRLPLGNDVTVFDLVCNDRTTNQSPSQSIPAEQYAGLSKGAQNVIDKIDKTSFISTGDYYQFNAPYIVTSFEKGYIKLHYNAYPVDSYGFPLIPDHYYYSTAIAYYIMWKILTRGLEHPAIRQKDAYSMWTHYKLLAQNKAKKMTADQRERFRRRWMTLIPEVNRWIDFGMNDHNPQQIQP